MKRICLHCKSHFKPSKYHHNQNYCYNKECQKARKALWQKDKIQKDPSYKANQKDATRCWLDKNPSYYLEYRKKHENYTAKNRKKSRERYQYMRYSGKISSASEENKDFAKMDVASSQLPVKSGRYKLMPLGITDFAKMDAAIVQLIVIEEVTKNAEFLQI
jgi:hypothetical protein